MAKTPYIGSQDKSQQSEINHNLNIPDNSHQDLIKREQVFQHQNEALKALIDHTDIQLAYLDSQFNFIEVNQAYAKGSGFSRENLLHKNHFELFPNAENQKIFEEVRDSGHPTTFHAKPFTFPNQPERGTTYWDWKLIPVINEDNQVRGMVLSLKEVTAEEKILRKSKFSALKLLLITSVVISVSEAIIMILLHLWPKLSIFGTALMDALLLAIITIPSLYFFLLRPVIANLSARRVAQEALQKAREKLESLVQERTRDLREVNKRLRLEIKDHEKSKIVLHHKTYDLEIRVKALNCLSQVSKLIVQPDLNLEQVLQQISDLTSRGVGSSPGASARITVENESFVSTEFRETEHHYSKPIQHKNKNIGKIEVFFQNPIAEDPKILSGNSDLELIDSISRLVGKYYQRFLTEKELRDALLLSKQRETEVTALLQGARTVLEQREFQDTAREIFNSCKELIGAQAGYVAMLSDDGTENEVLFLDSGGEDCTVDQNLPMPIRGLREKVYQKGETCYENHFQRSEFTQFLPEGHVVLKNVLFAPLLAEKKVLGLLGLANKPGGFSENDKRMATAFAELATIALVNSRTLESLENSERKFRVVAQSASDAVINIDSNGRVVFWNEAATKIFGHAAEHMLGKTISQLIPEEYREKHRRALKRVVTTGNAHIIGKTVELTGLRKNGSKFPVGLSLSAWNLGTQTFFTGIVRDISAQKKLEQELRNSKEKLEERVSERTRELSEANAALHAEIVERQRIEDELELERKRLYSVLDEIPAAIHLQDPDYRIRFANRYFRDQFGSPGDRPCYEILHSLDQPCHHCNAFKVFETGKPHEAEETHSDGRRYRIFNYPYTDTDGTVLVLQLGIDITEKSRMEKALKASEEHLRLLVNSLDDTVFTLNREQKLIEMYGNLVERLGNNPADLIGKTLQEIFAPRERIIHEKFLEKALQGESVIFEWAFPQPEGERFIQSSLAPIYDVDNKINRVVGVSRDITQQKILEKQTIQTEKLMALAEISAIISHEFRNSLTSIRMILELQLESPHLTASENKSLKVALSSIQHMENIVSQLLNFSRPSPVIFTTGHINAVLEESISFLEAQISKHRIKLIRQLEPDLPVLEFDRMHLKQVFINLILNAINAIAANPRRSAKREITLVAKKFTIQEILRDMPVNMTGRDSVSQEFTEKSEIIFREGDSCVLIEINDRGMGIKPEIMGRLFDPFFTTMAKGTGLGLVMVKRTINSHGGLIKVNSEKGKGTTFSIYLPLKKTGV
ncbi:MAG: PAS domain S-box protein [bacterium]|nr:MAG: PAS domain S-box protein [bacterium]